MKVFLLTWLVLMCLLPCIFSKVLEDQAALDTRDDEKVLDDDNALNAKDKERDQSNDEYAVDQDADKRAVLEGDNNKEVVDKRGWKRRCYWRKYHSYRRYSYYKRSCFLFFCRTTRYYYYRIYYYYRYYCYSYYVWGDPHYTSLDGKHFEFQGTCAYTLIKSCASGVTPFEIIHENYYASDDQRLNKVSSPKNVILKANGNTVAVTHDRRVIVNGMEKRLPVTIGDENKNITILTEPDEIVVETDFGVGISVRGLDSLTLNIPEDYQGKVCGMLGNYDGNPNNDFNLPDGSTAADSIEFGNHWKVAAFSHKNCDDGQLSTDSCDTDAKKEAAEQLCGAISDPQGVFKKCHSKVSPDVFKTDCVFDMCGDPGDVAFLCNAYEMYAASCAEHKKIIDWRKKVAQCPAKCMEFGEYHLKTSPCLNNCVTRDAEANCDADLLPVSGCKCSGSRLYDNGKCVEASECGCSTVDNSYYQQGDSWYEGNCTTICTCVGANNINCIASPDGKCLNGLSCLAQPDGSKDCRCKPGKKCARECNVAADGSLSSQFAISLRLPKESDEVIARTNKGGNDPCKAQVMVSTDNKGEVDGAVVSVGQGDEYAREYSFGGLPTVSGDGISGTKTFPFAPYDNNDISVTVSADPPGHKMKVKCDNAPMFTFTFNKTDVEMAHLEVNDEHGWTNDCFDF